MEKIDRKIASVKYRLYGHEENLRWCEKWNRILGISHIALSSCITALSLNGILEGGESVALANFILGCILTSVTSVINFMKFPNQIDSHRQAIQRYSQLLEETELFTIESTKGIDQTSLREFLKSLSKTYHHIKSSSPLLRERIYRENRKRFVDIVEQIKNIV